jgi:hypothetical protein
MLSKKLAPPLLFVLSLELTLLVLESSSNLSGKLFAPCASKKDTVAHGRDAIWNLN